MSIKIALAIIFCCYVFLGSVNAQRQRFDDKEFHKLKNRDRYKPKIPLPTRSPQNQHRNDQENRQQNGSKNNTLVEPPIIPRTQNPSKDNQRTNTPNLNRQNNRPYGSIQYTPNMLYFQQQQQQQIMNGYMKSYQYQQSSYRYHWCFN